jgi:hypothetical protein
VSHWLDDLVDGRNEDTVCRRLLDGPRLSGEFEHAKELFLHIYRPLIIKYTDKKFFGHLSERIDDACLAPFNRGSMLLGLNRVAYGAVLFSPRIAPDRRRDLLRDHNVFLKEWNVEGEQFTNEVEAIVDEMSAGEEAGSLLLGLTTKTVQEIAMASENYQMNIGLSLLFSILYAPLIYYHNVIEEVRQNEMILLQAFDTDYDLWVPWLERTRTAIDMLAGEKYSEDLARAVPRRSQMAMAYHCFEKMLPPVIDEHIRDIYVREPKKE